MPTKTSLALAGAASSLQAALEAVKQSQAQHHELVSSQRATQARLHELEERWEAVLHGSLHQCESVRVWCGSTGALREFQPMIHGRAEGLDDVSQQVYSPWQEGECQGRRQLVYE